MEMLQICILLKIVKLTLFVRIFNIIKFSKGIEGDISLLDVIKFLDEMKKVANEAYRVLKRGKMCAVKNTIFDCYYACLQV